MRGKKHHGLEESGLDTAISSGPDLEKKGGVAAAIWGRLYCEAQAESW